MKFPTETALHGFCRNPVTKTAWQIFSAFLRFLIGIAWPLLRENWLSQCMALNIHYIPIYCIGVFSFSCTFPACLALAYRPSILPWNRVIRHVSARIGLISYRHWKIIGEFRFLIHRLYRFCLAFLNRWSMDFDFGPGNAGLWTEILAEKKTQNLLLSISHWTCVFTWVKQILCVFGPRFPEFTVYSPGPYSPGPGSSDSKMPSETAFWRQWNIRYQLLSKYINMLALFLRINSPID